MLRVLIAACGILYAAACAASEHRNIRTFDFNRYFNHRYSECLHVSNAKNAVDILSVMFHDFAGDGSEEAMVVGSSCNTGTAGPDIHSVFRLNKKGQIKELKIREQNTFEGRPIYADLIGNRNFTFQVENGNLCEVFHDGSGRERPLIVCYKLQRNQFVIDRVKRGPIYRTSFDCARAQLEWTRAVCGTKDLADADIELHALYEQLLLKLGQGGRARLEAEQRDWEKSLSEAGVYKDFGDYLMDAYGARIRDLRSRLK